MERKPTFFTSDWHVGHANCLHLDSRPFRDLDHMHRVLINNFNSTVPSNGITYFLGDIGQGPAVEEVIKKLNGTKVCCLGNHDKGHTAMYNKGFDVVLNGASLVIAGHMVSMTHCPLLGVFREYTEEMKGAQPGAKWHGDHKQFHFTTHDNGQFHLHGHIHSPNSGKSQKILGRQRDVGVVGNDYRPISISEIESWIAKYGR